MGSALEERLNRGRWVVYLQMIYTQWLLGLKPWLRSTWFADSCLGCLNGFRNATSICFHKCKCMLAEDLHAKHGCFTFMLHAHAHSFEMNSSMHGWWYISVGRKGLFKLVFAGQKACYCKFINDWAWLKSPVCLLWLKVHLGSVLESEFQQKQNVKGM